MTAGGPPAERAVSPVLGYVLTLSIATLLVGGLLIAASGFVDGHRERTAESELQVIGEQLSADVSAVDRLNRTDDSDAATVSRSAPTQIVGYQYVVEVRDDGDGPTSPYLHLSAGGGDATATVGPASRTAVDDGSRVGGGDVEVAIVDDEVVIRRG